MPLLFDVLERELTGRVAALDYLVALGTHMPMDDAALSRLVGRPVRTGAPAARGSSTIAGTTRRRSRTSGSIPAREIADLTAGRLDEDVPVSLNRLVLEYDHVLICGPVFPHEVVGFSGGNKYLFPGHRGPRDHPLHALARRPHQQLRGDRHGGHARARRHRSRGRAPGHAASRCWPWWSPTKAWPASSVATRREAWREAAALSARRHIVWLDEPVDRVLAVMPRDVRRPLDGGQGHVQDGARGRGRRRGRHLRAPRARGQLRARPAHRRGRLPLPRLLPRAVGALPRLSGRDPGPFDPREGAGDVRRRAGWRRRASA